MSNGISILLVDGESMTFEKLSHNATYFSEEQFNVGLHFPLPSLLKQFLHFTRIPQPFFTQMLSGC